MSNRPIIIKKKKVVGGDGHHGGAWKVAYADFVTAMMAFFMLMWLLNATTEQQRKGLADYFSPSIPLAKVSGGGSGALKGHEITSAETMIAVGRGQAPFDRGEKSDYRTSDGEHDESDVAALQSIEDVLLGKGGESLVSDTLMRHVISRVTDEGLVIELFDLDDAALFESGTIEPTEIGTGLAQMLTRVFSMVENDVSVAAHIRTRPIVRSEDDTWPLTMGRADKFRRLLQGNGVSKERLVRTTGHGDHEPAMRDPMAVRNNRLEVILLRSDI